MNSVYAQILFLVSGVLNSILMQLLANEGASDFRSLMSTLTYYVGMYSVVFVGSDPIVSVNKKYANFVPSKMRNNLIATAVLDWFGSAFRGFGFNLTGSGLFQVIFSSIVIFSGILSYLLLNRKLNSIEWMGILGIAIGLATSVVGKDISMDSPEVVIGSFVVLLSSFSFGLVGVLQEMFLTSSDYALDPKTLCVTTGKYGLIITLSYFLLYTIPNWNFVITEPMNSKEGTWLHVIIILIILVMSNIARQYSYFNLLGSLGAVGAGVLLSIQAVLVFVISSLLFCSVQSSQCFNFAKGISTCIVVLGVLVKSYGTSLKSKDQ